MFIKVLYKDLNEMRVNPNCYIRLIYDYIRIKADVPDEYEMDICDRQGDLLKIYAPPFYRNGLEILENRETYVVILLQVKSKYGQVKLIPHINPERSLYDIMAKRLESNKLYMNLNNEICSLSRSKTNMSVESADVLKKKKKMKDRKSKKSKMFPSYIDKKNKSAVSFKHRDGYDGRQSMNYSKCNKNSKRSETLFSGRKYNWYINPSDMSIKKCWKK